MTKKLMVGDAGQRIEFINASHFVETRNKILLAKFLFVNKLPLISF